MCWQQCVLVCQGLKAPGKRGHIVADTNVSPFALARNICCGHKFCVRDTKNVSDFVQKHFVSATNVSQFAQPIRAYYVDFFVFFVLRHWWVSQVLTLRQSFPASRGLSRRDKLKREERDLCRLPTSFLSRMPSRLLNNQWHFCHVWHNPENRIEFEREHERLLNQPRPQGLLLDDFQNGGSLGEDPGRCWTNTLVDWPIHTNTLIGLNAS